MISTQARWRTGYVAFSSSGDIKRNFPQGLITGRTTTLLLDPNLADMHAKKVVASTQSHEVAHMWCVAAIYANVQVPSLEPLGSGISRLWSGGTTCT